MARIISFRSSVFKRILPVINRRLVSTSSKNNDTVTTEACSASAEAKALSQKNWVSYGFHTKSKEADRNAMHSIMFVSVTLCLAVASFYFAYMPDFTLKEWAQREAFLELRRREQNGLPLIDPNFIDPAKIVLPSDEELGDTEIII